MLEDYSESKSNRAQLLVEMESSELTGNMNDKQVDTPPCCHYMPSLPNL